MDSFNKIQYSKVKFVRFLFLFLSLLITILLINWQLIDNEKFLAIANERYKDIKLPSIRGSILASDGSTLAYSEPRYDVYIWLPEMQSAENRKDQTREEFLDQVSNLIGITREELEGKFNTNALWIKIATKISLDTKNLLLEAKASSGKYFTGIQFEYVNRRVYPEGRLASQLLGYVGLYDEQNKGVWGLEQYWDGSLKPVEGVVSSEFDSFGNPIALASSEFVESKPGSSLYTSIDKTLQSILEKKLQEGLIQFEAESVTGIILDPKTGAILAMGNYPNFDPNKYYEEKDYNSFGNKAISTPYEIGSVAKSLTLAAAIDLGRITPDQILLPNGHEGCEIISPNPAPKDNCRNPESNKLAEKPVECICTYNKGGTTKSLSVTDVLMASDNIGFRHIALTMTYQEFYSYLKAFGAGAPTRVDLPDESYANLKDYTKWNYADQAVYSYGHGYSMTPLETVSAVGAIANDGYRMQPYLVEKVVDADNNITEFKPKILAKPIKKETADTVKEMMHKVYLNQLIERKYKDLKKYNIALKSGTALIPHTDRAGYSSEINTTFVGFDASDEKTFVMLLKLEKPQVGDLSYYNARILWLDTFIAIKDYLKVPSY